MDQNIIIQKGDLVRLRGEPGDFLYLVAYAVEDEIDSYLIKLYDEKGKLRPVEGGMFYKAAALEVVASR